MPPSAHCKGWQEPLDATQLKLLPKKELASKFVSDLIYLILSSFRFLQRREIPQPFQAACPTASTNHTYYESFLLLSSWNFPF